MPDVTKRNDKSKDKYGIIQDKYEGHQFQETESYSAFGKLPHYLNGARESRV